MGVFMEVSGGAREAYPRRTHDQPMQNRLYIDTYGCQMNEYDSARMADVLRTSHGMELTDDAETADVALFNTCSIRAKAEQKVYSALGRWREWKRRRPGRVIGVGGCVASQEGAAIFARAPYVDVVFGPQTLHRLPALLERARAGERAIDISFPEMEKFDRLPEPRAAGPTAFVSIMEGCSKYCSFCVVPYTRGEEISRPLDAVLAELLQLSEQGTREVTLLGQNVNAYLGTTHDGHGADLATLIEYAAAIPGIGRIRYTTSHPVNFSDRLIDAYGRVPELADHLHLPVQSGSDDVLSMMKRGYTVADYKDRVRRLRRVRPGIRLSSDFIVGFPGETDADFSATMELARELDFDNSYCFMYSPRPGTPAAELSGQVAEALKKERLHVLQEQLTRQAGRHAQALVGSVQRVLVEGSAARRSERELCGRTACNRVVNFAAPATLAGQFANVHITAAMPNCLRGRLVEHAASLAHAARHGTPTTLPAGMPGS